MNECTNCDCYDPDMGCTMPSIDRQYACPLYECDSLYSKPIIEVLGSAFNKEELSDEL